MDAIPHLALPLRVENGDFVAVEQDTVDELVACVGAICSFPLGSRVEAPEFGIPEHELGPNPPPTNALERAIETWEPRADVTVTAVPDPDDPLTARLRVAVTMPDAEED